MAWCVRWWTSMKRIDSLTPEQEARFGEWRDKWIAVGLKTGEADWETFENAVKITYEKAGLVQPKVIVQVQSPIVGAFAAPIAEKIIEDRTGKKSGAVRGAVDDAVGGAVRGAVRGAVDGAVDDAPTYVKNGWYKLLGGQFWAGGWYWGSPSYVSFFTEVCGLELSEDIAERAKAYQDIAQSVCWWWPHSDFVMVCNRPSAINRDEAGQLHSETGKAIEWPDGWGFHALHGIRFYKDPELWEKIVSGTMTAKEVTEVQDADKKRLALTYLKGDDFITQMKAELVDEGHPMFYEHLPNRRIKKHKYIEGMEMERDGNIVVNRLYKVKAGDVYEQDKYFLYYANPSMKEESHMKFVTKWVKDLGEDADAIQAATHNTDKKQFMAGLGA